MFKFLARIAPYALMLAGVATVACGQVGFGCAMLNIGYLLS